MKVVGRRAWKGVEKLRRVATAAVHTMFEKRSTVIPVVVLFYCHCPRPLIPRL